MGASHERGRRGERIAERHLSERGWEVLDRNWRSGHQEVDLVVRRKAVLAFVEVKTRSQAGSGDPLESITGRKRLDIGRVAVHWLRAHGRFLGAVDTLRFDAVAVDLVPGRLPRVRHVADAWRIGEL